MRPARATTALLLLVLLALPAVARAGGVDSVALEYDCHRVLGPTPAFTAFAYESAPSPPGSRLALAKLSLLRR